MLPNRTYNELNESCFSQTELSEEAKLRAGLSARKNRRSSLQLTADRKTLIAIYKKMQEQHFISLIKINPKTVSLRIMSICIMMQV